MIQPKAFVLVPIALALAACGGLPFVSAAQPSPSPNQYQAALAYAQCMRSHGVPDFPDPDPSGVITIAAGPGSDLDKSSSAFQTAANACKSLLPGGKAGRGRGLTQADKQKFLAYSACMRSHGVPDFPDPNFSQSGVQITLNGNSSSDLNRGSPVFQAADQACRSLLPGGGQRLTAPGTSGSGGGAKVGTRR